MQSSRKAVRDRPFTPDELEKMRLLLSTFKDGSGQSVKAGYMPDYLAFERCTALVCEGKTGENKGIFDVSVPGSSFHKPWGISCKMTVAQSANRSSWFMELSNSAKKFADAFAFAGVNWVTNPEAAGPIIVRTVESWHTAVASTIDVANSKYLLITHDTSWRDFEIACFDLNLKRAHPVRDVSWVVEGRNETVSSLAGYIDIPYGRHRLWQFFGNSGGQLKYFPRIGWELWRTGSFRLKNTPVVSLKDKVDQYWPGAWPE